ncbi:MAG TPA: hypothetical protein DEQ28_06525 [Clostridiales bacterium]|nr:hypothetical protein [Clostridiales bacterium]
MNGGCLGVAGTAKNTGKTTTLAAILREAAAARAVVGVTSIGYDGEDLDHITGLPKPRLLVTAGTLVATAEPALAGRPEFELLERTPVRTALGRVSVARVARPARAILAGPAGAAGLGTVLDLLRRNGADLVLVDGAFGRLAPMTAVDGLLIATGAARRPEAAFLAREAAAITRLCSLPEMPGKGRKHLVRVRGPASSLTLPYPALLDLGWAEEVARRARAAGGFPTEIYLPGPVGAAPLERLGQGLSGVGSVMLVFSHPLHLLAGGDALAVSFALDGLESAGHRLAVRQGLRLLGLTVNPYYPAREGGTYRAAQLDAAELLASVRAAVDVPVTDVVLEGSRVLWDRIWGRAGEAGYS